jgi:hypothetical protein
MRWTWPGTLVVAAISLTLVRTADGAEPPIPLAPPRVTLFASVDPPDDALATLIERHLRAALGARGIDVALSPPAGFPDVAEIQIHVEHMPGHGPQGTMDIVATMAITDRITHKRVERAMNLTDVPEDGRALAIASSTDELLRASWVELTLADAPEVEPPPAVVKAVDFTVKSPARWLELGFETTSSFLANRTAVGGNTRLGAWLTPHISAFLAIGASYGLSATAPDGSVRADALALEGGVAYALVPATRLVGADLEGSISGLYVFFVAQPNRDAEGSSFRDGALIAGARARGWLGSSRIRATLSLGGTYALRATRAFDRGEVVTSEDGFGGEVRVGVWMQY